MITFTISHGFTNVQVPDKAKGFEVRDAIHIKAIQECRSLKRGTSLRVL